MGRMLRYNTKFDGEALAELFEYVSRASSARRPSIRKRNSLSLSSLEGEFPQVTAGGKTRLGF